MPKIGEKTIKFIAELILESLKDAADDLNILFLKVEDDLKIRLDCILSVGEQNGIQVDVKLKSAIPDKVERELNGTVFETQLPLEFDPDKEV